MKNLTKNHRLFKKAIQVIPLASQTFSKSYLQYVKGVAPLFLDRARGAYVWDIDGNRYLDLINGLLPVILGYQYPAVDQAIRRQLKRGITFSLPAPLEYELAELLIKHVPCAEMVRFGKNGSDVTTGAIRLARAVTHREHVAVCGYHGWHDWFIGSTTRNLGVPKSTQKLTHRFIYNDPDSLKKIMKQYKLAAVIMEPMNYVEPAPEFLSGVKNLAARHGALLIFDEIITGFRFDLGGAQKLFGVTPDLATFGKSMANGMPISALVGRKKYMEKVSDIFFSSTFGGETLSLAAAIATIRELEKKSVIKKLWRLGEYLQTKTKALITETDLADCLSVEGKPVWQIIMIKPVAGYSILEIKSYLQQELLQAGFLWLGQHNLSYRHTKQDFDRLLKTYEQVFKRLKKLLDSNHLREALRGAPITDIFKIR